MPAVVMPRIASCATSAETVDYCAYVVTTNTDRHHISACHGPRQCVVSRLLQRESSSPYIEAYRLLKLKYYQPELRDGTREMNCYLSSIICVTHHNNIKMN